MSKDDCCGGCKRVVITKQGERGFPGPTGPKGTNGLNGAIGPTGTQGTQGTQGIQGIEGQSGTTILHKTHGLVVSPFSSTPYLVDNSLLGNEDDSLRITYIGNVVNPSPGNFNLNNLGSQFYTYSLDNLKTGYVKTEVILSRVGADMVGYATTVGVTGDVLGDVQVFTISNWFLSGTFSLSLQSTADPDVLIGEWMIELLKK